MTGISTSIPSSTADVVSSWPSFSSLSLFSPSPYIVHLELCHGRYHTMTRAFWTEMQSACQLLTQHSSVIRAVILTGRGDIFSAGLDLNDHSDLFHPPTPSSDVDISRLTLQKLPLIENCQRAISALELLPQPIIALIHGAAVGGAVDLVTACDIRLATASATFCVKEVDLGICADVGTLQRLGKIVGSESAVREWSYTARTVKAEEAMEVGLVSRPLYKGKEEGWSAALSMASTIAAKSPIAILGTKRVLVHARDHSVREGLEFVAQWNSVHLQSADVGKSAAAQKKKQKPIYSNL